MAQHDDMTLIYGRFFTGSTMNRRTVHSESGGESNLNESGSVSLELGGKFHRKSSFDDNNNCDDDDDLDRIADHVMSAVFFWNQSVRKFNCSCGSRLLVQKGIKENEIITQQQARRKRLRARTETGSLVIQRN
mmetsp:Transcript_28542/g.43602  ORF Transcript_28542/g.43602 Transcript_28542/m.43602 type:complete len:133 (-) Transcript_28542:499-897(-)